MSIEAVLKRNAFYNYLYVAVYSLVNFIVSPIAANILGSSEFGLWKTLSKLVDSLSFTDGRSSQYLKPLIPKIEDKNEINSVISSCLGSWCLFLPVMFVSAAVVSILASRYFHSDGSDYSYVMYVTVLLFLNLYINSMVEIADSIFTGLNESYISKLIQTIYVVVSNCFFVTVCYVFDDLVIGLVSNSISIALCTFLMLLVLSLKFTWLKLVKNNLDDVKNFLMKQKWYLFWSASEKILLSGEIILIGFLVGTEYATVFTFSAFVMQFCISVSIMAGASSMPIISSLLSKGELSAASNLVSRSLTEVIFFVGFFGFFILACNKEFVTLWVGEKFYFGISNDAIYIMSASLLVLLRFLSQVHDLTLNIYKRVYCFSLVSFVSMCLVFFGFIGVTDIDDVIVFLAVFKVPVIFCVVYDLYKNGLRDYWKSKHFIFVSFFALFFIVIYFKLLPESILIDILLVVFSNIAGALILFGKGRVVGVIKFIRFRS
jgi:O-antigen/teichoic acid export membrane protein